MSVCLTKNVNQLPVVEILTFFSFPTVEWFFKNFTFDNAAKKDYLHLLEESLNRLLIIDLSVYRSFSSPYIRYIYECYFVNQQDQNIVNEVIHFISSLQLDLADLDKLKLLILLQSGTIFIDLLNDQSLIHSLLFFLRSCFIHSTFGNNFIIV